MRERIIQEILDKKIISIVRGVEPDKMVRIAEALYEGGFRYFFGVCYNSTPWMNITDNTIRIGTITVNGENITKKTAFFDGMFDASLVVENP